MRTRVRPTSVPVISILEPLEAKLSVGVLSDDLRRSSLTNDIRRISLESSPPELRTLCGKRPHRVTDEPSHEKAGQAGLPTVQTALPAQATLSEKSWTV